MEQLTLRVKAIRRKLAARLRAVAEWLAPTPITETDKLMPLARATVKVLADTKHKGSIKWLLGMKMMERETGAKRRHINAAIDRAVLELHGD